MRARLEEGDMFVRFLVSANNDPFAFRVNFVLGIDSYRKFDLESEIRCWQVWKCHLHA